MVSDGGGHLDIVEVALGERSYEVRIGPGLIDRAGAEIAPLLARPRVAVVTEERVAALHLDALKAGLASEGIAAEALVLPAGEATKSWAHLQEVVEWLLGQQIERKDMVVAFGGGVIGDLVGFAAAVLRRGVRFVQIPTTLLAQVDSSVGGKTGINSPHGKVVKYGGLGSLDFFEWLEVNGPALAAGDRALRQEAVRRSVQMKADIVARDETEQGVRALLNLGHTFGHALEAATGYSDRLLHGEGVAIGCALAFETSARLGLMSQEAPSRLRAHLSAMGMKRDLADIPGDLPDTDGLIALMGQDKKVEAGQIRFILARAIGEAFVADGVDLDVVRGVLSDGLAER